MKNLIATALLSTLLPAQMPGIYYVDDNGIAHFSDITTAVAIVPNGSTLLVSAGHYAPVLIDGKAITILCDAGVTVSFSNNNPMLEIRNTAPGQPVAVRGLQQIPLFYGNISVHDAAGPVSIDGLHGALTNSAACCSVLRSGQVCVRNYTFRSEHSNVVFDANVVFESCSLTATNNFSGFASALTVTNGSVQAVQCSFQGAHGMTVPKFLPWTGAPAVTLDNSSFRAMGRSVDRILAGAQNGAPVRAVAGTGTARIDAAIVVWGSAPIDPRIAVTRPNMPRLFATDSALGGNITVNHFGPTGAAFLIAVSFPGLRSRPASLIDPLWLDPGSASLEALGIVYSGIAFQLQKSVPNVFGLTGTQLNWQSFDVDLNGGLAASNPSACVIY